ncbi:MAG: lysophospholipid acyltransferase family protein [Candidatus Thermoplasmatota archaeon]|nr:lysophospholipid acyltransferase family protein [Candidatus Thermoplasmatota archaeon]
MVGLSSDSLETVAKLTGLDGTGNTHESPMFYKGLMQLTPALVRTITNVSYTGVERIPKKGPAILVGNHTSHIDPIIKIMGAKRPVHYLAKAEHFEDKKFQKLMTSTGQIETFRDSGGVGALASAVDVLSSGNVMGIFPEGTRSRNKKPPYLSRGKTGVARLAARFPEVPVVPMAIIGARNVMAPGSAIVNPLAKVQVNIDNPITFGNWLGDPEGGSMSDDDVSKIAELDEHGQRSMMKSHYRKFTDQLIENLRILGAP